MASQSQKGSTPLNLNVTSVNKKNNTSPTIQKKSGITTRSATASDGKVAMDGMARAGGGAIPKDTATVDRKTGKEGMAITTIGVGGVAGVVGSSRHMQKMTDASELQQSQSPEAAVPSTGVDGGRTFSQTMGPLHTSNKDAELKLQEYKLLEQKFQEQAKLLEQRTKELGEKDQMVNSATEERNELLRNLGEKDNRIHDLEYWLTNDKQAIVKLQSESLQLQTDIRSRDVYIEQRNDAFTHEQEKHQETREKAQLAEYNYADAIQKLKAERNELRSRLSKVASDMLTAGGNPDIADLSDPNRAMKLSERFSGIYDDDWTDAYETLTQKYKKDAKEAIQFLLSLLQECLEFCKQTSQSQMDALRNVFMHPCQSASQDVKAGKEKARIDSSGVKALMDLRRRISTTSAYEVKVQCMAHMKQQRKRSGEADLIAAASAYCDKCTDICWLMVLHDPPLHVALDVKPGTKMDTAHYSSYGGTGEVIDYLVWPPLYNGVGGGLLAKGTASPIPSASKKKPRK